jgi:putative transposase
VYVSFVVYHEFPKFPRTNGVVAPDVGMGSRSWPRVVPNLRHGEGTRELRKLHGDLSRKEFLSKNWSKRGRARPGRGRSKELRDVRLGKHFPEKYDVVVMGDVQVKELVGRSSRRMRLRDVAFHELETVLKYQVEKYGKELVLVEPSCTSKACAMCGRVRD